MQQDDAFRISESFLERTGKCLMTGDFANFGPCFLVPQALKTFDRMVRIKTQAGLERAFRRMHEAFMGLGATDLLRRMISREFNGPVRILAPHESLVLRHGHRLKGPYPVLSTLVHGGRGLADRQRRLCAGEGVRTGARLDGGGARAAGLARPGPRRADMKRER